MSTQSSGQPSTGEAFDPTNGWAGNQMGESDGTADGELISATERGEGGAGNADAGDGDEGDPSLVDDPKRPIGDGNEPAILGRLLDDD
jgi:hypothetical protein